MRFLAPAAMHSELRKKTTKLVGRIMCLDVGESNTGVSFTDPNMKSVSYSLFRVLHMLHADKEKKSVAVIGDQMNYMVKKFDVRALVVGIPDGFPPHNLQAKKIMAFLSRIHRLGVLGDLMFTFIDEVESTMIAEEEIVRLTKINPYPWAWPHGLRKDQLASAEILQRYLNLVLHGTVYRPRTGVVVSGP